MIHESSTMQHIWKALAIHFICLCARAIAQTDEKYAMKRSQQALHFICYIFYKFGAFAHIRSWEFPHNLANYGKKTKYYYDHDTVLLRAKHFAVHNM